MVEKTLVADSGGAGKHRGGLGVRTRLRKLHDDGLPTLFSVYPEGVGVATDGLFGGHAGGGVRGVVLDRAGNVVHDCGTGELVTLTSRTAWSRSASLAAPASAIREERPQAAVDDDVADGYVSPEGARHYGARPAAATAAE